MGGFKILFTDIDKFEWCCKDEMEKLISACEETITDIEKFNELASFSGQSAIAIKTYLLQVHGAIVKAIQIIAQEFLDQTIKYKYGYLSINEAAYYTLPQDTIQTCKDRYSSALTAVQMETTRIKNSIQNIRDIYYIATPSVSTVESEHKAIDTKLKDFIEKISNHETKDTPTNLEMLTVLLSALRKSLADCSSRNPSQISSYSNGDFFKIECNTELAYYADLCYTYHEQIKDDLDEVWDYEVELHDKLEEGRKTQGTWQIIGGVCLVVAGVVCIVATAGAATPIVVAGAVAGGGTVAFGAAEMYEGGENIYLGSSGDISTTAFNPIRDTAFQGNQEAYDFTKGAFAFTASALTPIGTASTAGNLTVRSGAYIVGEVAVSDAAGGLTSKGTAELCEQWGLDPNVTQAVSMVSGMVASGATSKGLTTLDTKLNISGMHTKVQPTTQSEIISKVESGEITLDDNMAKGNYGEMKMDQYYESRGYKRISGSRVESLDASTHQGIDGVYYNPDGNLPYIVAEAKYGTSRLGKAADGSQMSQVWIENRLEKAVGGKDLADDILFEGYKKQLVKVEIGNVNIIDLK